MNKLYIIQPKVFLNGEQLYGTTWRLNPPLHYGEISDEPETLLYTDFDLAWKENLLHCYKDETIFSKKRVIVGQIDDTHKYRVPENKFISYEVVYSIHTCNINDFTIIFLMKNLSVEDFVKLCKDLSLSQKEVNGFVNE